MATNVNNFVAQLQGGGARANQFKVEFPSLGNGMEFLARSAQIPALTIGEIAVPYRGRQIFVPGDRTYDAWTLTVFNDTGYSIRSLLEGWANQIQNIGAVVSQNGPAYRDAKVHQLSRDGEHTLRSYNLFGVWPTTIDAIDLAWDTNDTIEEYGVTFRFNYMTVNNLQTGSGRATNTFNETIPTTPPPATDRATVAIDANVQASFSGTIG